MSLLKSLEEAISRADLETVFSVWSAARGSREFYAVKKLTNKKLNHLALENGIDVPVKSFRQLMQLYDGRRELKELVNNIFVSDRKEEILKQILSILFKDDSGYLVGYFWELLLSLPIKVLADRSIGGGKVLPPLLFLGLSFLQDAEKGAVLLVDFFNNLLFAQEGLTKYRRERNIDLLFRSLLDSALYIYNGDTTLLAAIGMNELYAKQVLASLFILINQKPSFQAEFHLALLGRNFSDRTINKVMYEYAQTITPKEMVALHEVFLKALIYDESIIHWLEEAGIYEEMMDLIEPTSYGEDDIDEYY